MVSSGQDCKYKINEVDEFTKSKILETNFEWLSSNLGCSFKKINEQKAIKLQIESSSVFSISDGSKIMFLTEKDNPITLIFSEYEISKMSSLTNFYIITFIKLTDEDNSRLLSETVNKIRIYTTDGYVDYSVKEKRAKKFQDILKCIQ